MKDEAVRKRYYEKLRLIEGLDPTRRRTGRIVLTYVWPSITHINVGMLLLLIPGANSGDDLLNYKSM